VLLVGVEEHLLDPRIREMLPPTDLTILEQKSVTAKHIIPQIPAVNLS
jgi:hypothetical protein